MKKYYALLILSLLWVVQPSGALHAESPGNGMFPQEISPDAQSFFPPEESRQDGPRYDAGGFIQISQNTKEGEVPEEAPQDAIADPLEAINRVFFEFNDKLYFWLLKPLATGYKAVTPQILRVSIKDFFYNLAFPIRFVNCFFQGKFEAMGHELTRFMLNTTLGFAGFFDPATSALKLPKHDEDFGQTLGIYGFGSGFYIHWPVLGPSSVRGTFGYAGDYFLDPVSYVDPYRDEYAIKAGDGLNRTSLQLGDYEDLKKSAIDPYVAVRNAYIQYRNKKIEE
ncbi:MAG: VacJ family lipoprotein [Pseudomonadota bacterium]